jgi:transcriptional regulator, AraC family
LTKKEIGSSAQEYVLAKTMDTAKELLADPIKSVSNVAYALGYQYPQYFSKALKQYRYLFRSRYSLRLH